MIGAEDIARKTYFWDKLRGSSQGVLETGYMGLTLVIAIEVFDAPNEVKSLIAAANPIGLLITPLTLGFFAWLSRPANIIASNLLFLSGLCIAVAAFSSSLNIYLVLLILSAVFGTQSVPMMAHIYAENYPPNKRGTYFSTSFMFSVAATSVFSLLFGWLMDLDIGFYVLVLGVLSLASFASGVAMRRMPSTPVHQHSTQNPIRNIGYAFTDWKFGIMLLSWMFLGLGNLMANPLRIEYLLKPEYGVAATISLVSFITLFIPAVFRFLSARMWGILFDRIDFMLLRIAVNSLQMISIWIFFQTTNIWILGFSTALNGIAMGGGTLSWNLWVTKFAPQERTAAYMIVHTFLTGIRGFAAPFMGFYLLVTVGAKKTGGIGSILILISIIMVYVLYLNVRPKRKS
ncbi:MFS transporter [Opitutia bacterium ISCC 51]|nr:MFS transporter [Opitutae bacterium ISCC 51]QXD28915.1 MFS transporter [Opitutae bacterium ISCC 52]